MRGNGQGGWGQARFSSEKKGMSFPLEQKAQANFSRGTKCLGQFSPGYKRPRPIFPRGTKGIGQFFPAEQKAQARFEDIGSFEDIGKRPIFPAEQESQAQANFSRGKTARGKRLLPLSFTDLTQQIYKRQLILTFQCYFINSPLLYMYFSEKCD